MYKHKSILISKKKESEIKQVIVASQDPNLIFMTRPRVLFELIYLYGYISLQQSTINRYNDPPGYTREYYSLSKKGENYMKFLYPKG